MCKQSRFTSNKKNRNPKLNRLLVNFLSTELNPIDPTWD